MTRIVLGYTGGLDTSVAIPWLAERYGAEVIALTLDVGQGRELVDVRERALSAGAVRAHVLDVRDEFMRDHVLPSLQAGALYEDRYPMATALAHPLVGKHLVEIARMEGAGAIAHGCQGKGNDQVRLEAAILSRDPQADIIAPARLWDMPRAAQVDYARRRGIAVPAAPPAYTIDANLWGRSVSGGRLDDLWVEPPEDIYTLTRAARDCPDEPAYLEIEFESGVPVRTNGVDMSPIELVESLDTIAGSHGVGRIDIVENRLVGFKSREVYEAPAAVVLHMAHRELRRLVMDRDLDRLSGQLGRAYADLVYNGRWFSATREAIDAFARAIQPRVTGSVRMKLFKGDCHIVGRRSANALYDRDLVAAASAGVLDRAVEGFTKIWGLPSETAAATTAAAGSRSAVGRS